MFNDDAGYFPDVKSNNAYKIKMNFWNLNAQAQSHPNLPI